MNPTPAIACRPNRGVSKSSPAGRTGAGGGRRGQLDRRQTEGENRLHVGNGGRRGLAGSWQRVRFEGAKGQGQRQGGAGQEGSRACIEAEA